MLDLKAALRSLSSTPWASAVVVLTLALAIGMGSAVFGVVRAVLLLPLGYDGEDDLVVLWSTQQPPASDATSAVDAAQDLFRLSPADYADLRQGADSFAGKVALYRAIGSTLTGLDPVEQVGSFTVTPSLFEVLGARAAAGRLFSDDEERRGGERRAVITHAAWQRRFGGDPSIVGSVLELDGEPHTVIGVTGPGFTFPPGDTEVEVYLPMVLSGPIVLERDHRMFDAIARLAPNVSLDRAQAELETIGRRLEREYPQTNLGWRLIARPLRRELVGDLAPTLQALLGAVALLLVVASVNVANLLVARAGGGLGRELSVRTMLGARPRHLLRRLLAESLVLGVAGAVLGVVLSIVATAWLGAVLPSEIARLAAVRLDGAVLLMALGLALLATVLFTVLPAVHGLRGLGLCRREPLAGSTLGGGERGARRLREALVAVEVALAVTLVVAAVLLGRSLRTLEASEPGLRPENLTAVSLKMPRSSYSRAEWRPFYERLAQRLAASPGVQRVGATSDLPLSSVGLGFEIELTAPGLAARSPTVRPNAEVRLVLPGTFEAAGMRLIAGRDFTTSEHEERGVTVVNETLARRVFGELDPLGRTLELQNIGEFEVVGVVEDVLQRGLTSRHESELYLPFGRPIATMEMHLLVRTDRGDLGAAAVGDLVRSILSDIDPQLVPSRVVGLEELLWRSVARPRFNAALIGLLALSAALLAVAGVHGIVVYDVARRRREIGVRMALGADAPATAALVVRQSLRLVLLGAAFGLASAAALGPFVERLLHGVEPLDPLTYGSVALGAVATAALASVPAARRAVRVDPSVALRSD
ncbi:MAG: hypothetical protein DWQ36_15020 [Acidobacteria bacterium]|nr:MAG: hypothetical protein DWQ36_15020 [Acidobacteriota bacterium]